jgi:hypothetical protein
MAAWIRREQEPDTSLTEARKDLVHSYMDAEEADARRQAVEQRERQSRMREQARLTAAEAAIRRQAATATDAGHRTADHETGRVDDDVARQVAAAAAEAREEARREAEDETARRVAVAVEEALREAKDETARQVAEAVARARQEASEAAPHRPREPEPQKPAPPLAATLRDTRPQTHAKPLLEPAEEALQEPNEEMPEHKSTEGLPLSERVEAATRTHEAPARVDWTRDLLRAKKNTRPSLTDR